MGSRGFLLLRLTWGLWPQTPALAASARVPSPIPGPYGGAALCCPLQGKPGHLRGRAVWGRPHLTGLGPCLTSRLCSLASASTFFTSKQVVRVELTPVSTAPCPPMGPTGPGTFASGFLVHRTTSGLPLALWGCPHAGRNRRLQPCTGHEALEPARRVSGLAVTHLEGWGAERSRGNSAQSTGSHPSLLAH